MPAEPEFDLLFVCTGNICRSPMAELLAAGALRRELGPLAGRFRVHSAGTRGLAGWSIQEHAARALAEEHGLPAEAFRARRLTGELAGAADLVLTATREHRADVVRVAPGATARTFTLREFAALAAAVPEEELPGSDPVERARALVAAAAARRGAVRVEDEDVADPYGSDYDVYRRCGAEIAAALHPPLTRLAARRGP